MSFSLKKIGFRMSCKKSRIDAAINDLNQALTTCFIQHGIEDIVITKARVLILTLEGEGWLI